MGLLLIISEKGLYHHCLDCETLQWHYEDYTVPVGLHKKATPSTAYVCKAFKFDTSRTLHIVE